MRKLKIFVTAATALVLTLAFTVFGPGSGFAKPAKPITINFVSYVALAHPTAYKFLKREFIDKINEQAKGELFIKVRGGPEVIRSFDLGVAVQKRTIELATIPTAFFESLVPGADSTKMSIYTAWEERENGIYEYIQDMYKKGRLFYVGRAQATEPGYFSVYLNKRVEKPQDFVGLKLGGSTAFHGFYKALGASVATVPLPEYYSAMERGVVDGICTSIYLGITFGIVDVTKYIISQGVYRCTAALVMNPDAWNELPKHLQKLFMDTMVEFEKKYTPYDLGLRADAVKKAEAAGVEMITFSPDVTKWFLKAADDGSWKYAQERFPGDVIPKLRERITK
jgi:TRAP-type C4-dicarboxylate transport system substrate-binding protein